MQSLRGRIKNLDDMKIRVAKKILKNQETLKYHKHQVTKAETVVRRYKKNAPAETAE